MIDPIARKHVCECVNCNPGMVPDYNINDSVMHSRAKCGRFFRVLDNGKDVGYTTGVTKIGQEGFYLFAGVDSEDIHTHKCVDVENACLELRFGNVTVVHDDGLSV